LEAVLDKRFFMFLMRAQIGALLLAFPDYAEEVTIRVFQHAEVIIWGIPLTMTFSSDFEQSVHFSFSVAGGEVKMESISASSFGDNSS
jgi:hypothetical protein